MFDKYGSAGLNEEAEAASVNTGVPAAAHPLLVVLQSQSKQTSTLAHWIANKTKMRKVLNDYFGEGQKLKLAQKFLDNTAGGKGKGMDVQLVRKCLELAADLKKLQCMGKSADKSNPLSQENSQRAKEIIQWWFPEDFTCPY